MSDAPNVVPLKTAKRQRNAGATSGGKYDDDRPIIQIHSGKLPEATDHLAAALKRTPGDLFQQSARLVRPKSSLIANADGRKTPNYIIEPAGLPYLIERAGRAAHFEKWDHRSSGWVKTDCPRKLAEGYADRSSYPELRELAGIITAPTLRPNGSLLSTPGHDAATNLLYLPGGQAFPRIKHRPDRRDAEEALAFLDRHLVTPFPFVDEASRSGALAAFLTGVTRRTLPTAPMTAVKAHVAASGKTHFCNTVSMVATGRPAPAITQGRTEEEFEKRIGAALVGGVAVLLIDNCEHPVGGAFLCQVVSEESSTVRLLGASRNVEVLNNALILVNGNNLILTGDITRRGIQCTLDPRVERPELRRFDSDPLVFARANRGKCVAAALTVLLAHMLADWRGGPPPLASFVAWSRRVRNSLLWLGRADPCDTITQLREADPKLIALTAIIEQWAQVIGDKRATAAEVIGRASERDEKGHELVHPDFYRALAQVAAGDRGQLDARRLGRWLVKVEGSIIQARRITNGGVVSGVIRWLLQIVEGPP